MKTLILGNAGAGKSRLAATLVGERSVFQLSLDQVAFSDGAQRRPLRDSVALCEAAIAEHADWVIEGCYADIIQALLPHCDQLLFLNPGVAACLAHCRQRPWEPEKFASAEAQAEHLPVLLDWVASYPQRTDEYGLAAHRAVFSAFGGPKQELRLPAHYARDARQQTD